MKSFLGLWGFLLLLHLMGTYADDWTVIHLQCADQSFHLRIKPTLFPNIYMEYDEVFLGIGCPVTAVWPNDSYEFTYSIDSCGIVKKALQDVTLLQTKLTYISRNNTLQVSMPLSCVLRQQQPHFCEAGYRRDFTDNLPELRNEQAALTMLPNFSTSNEDHQVCEEAQASESRRLRLEEVFSFMDQNSSALHFSIM
ncbi:putative oocyte-secreted protein 1 homolog [Acomys russatus]|uniref:putative oocyte-secreted protein 1 homolog n=1 Tax=Acomys russatus TaxID=60746 RepID=UPI0021E2BF1E|nr:putative oocyte-secreted protein 1 homolog [Acomys russatus]